jgi:hypothetical protein
LLRFLTENDRSSNVNFDCLDPFGHGHVHGHRKCVGLVY